MIKKGLRRFAGLFNRVRLANKMMLVTVILCALPILFISLALYRQMEERIRSEQDLYYEKEIDRYVLTLEAKLTGYNNFAARLANDQYIYAGFQDIGRSSLREAYLIGKDISEYTGWQMANHPKVELHNITFYSGNEEHPVYSHRVTTLEVGRTERWHEHYLRSDNPEGFVYYPGEAIADYLSIIKPLRGSTPGGAGESLGLVRLDLITERIFANTWSFGSDKYSLYMMLEGQEEPVFSKNPGLHGLPRQEDRPSLFGPGDGTVREGYLLFSRRAINRTGLYLYMVIDDSAMLQKARDARRTLWMAGGSLAAVTTLLSAAFSHLMVKRINRLVHKMSAIRDGDFEIAEIIDGSDEIAQLDESFNNMVAMLKMQIEQNYIQSHLTREAEFNALKFQINPHFLFNTLETINSMASVYGVREIGVVSQKLGEMLQYSLHTGLNDPAPLRCELNHIRNYIFIQKIRYDDRFDVVYDISPELGEINVIPFILQPVVENVLKHCIDGSEGHCAITISARRERGDLVISVVDDGPGIPGSQAEEMNRGFARPDKINLINFSQERGIGLKNVNARLRIRFGTGYGLSVNSGPEQGTCVAIRIPCSGLGNKEL